MRECCKWVGHLACLSRWERLRIAVLGRNGGSEEVGLNLCLSGHLQLQVTKKRAYQTDLSKLTSWKSRRACWIQAEKHSVGCCQDSLFASLNSAFSSALRHVPRHVARWLLGLLHSYPILSGNPLEKEYIFLPRIPMRALEWSHTGSDCSIWVMSPSLNHSLLLGDMML